MKSILLLLLLFSLFLNAQEYSLDAEKSAFSWTGKAAFNTYKLTGTLKAKFGKILIENDSIKNLEVLIDMKTLHHKNNNLKKHLRNEDFFEVKKFETAIFKLTKSSKINSDKTILNGVMTIKNCTKKEQIEAEFLNDGKIKISFKAKLDRTKYGVKFNSPSIFKKMKENAIADEFDLKGVLIFN